MAQRRAILVLTSCCLVAATGLLGPAADPMCHNGVQKSGVCCPKACGKLCGAPGCSRGPGGGAACCASKIKAAGKSCVESSAPCVMGVAGCTFSEGEEYVGNEIELIQNVSSKGDCCSACASSTKCKYFTYDSTKSTCSLKSENAPDTSRINPACSSGFVGGDPPAPDPPAVVSVSVAGPVISRTEPSFVCWNLDASRNRQFFDRNLSQSTALGAQMSRQAAAISAVQEDGYSLLRFGGTGNDYLTYEVGGTSCPEQTEYTECLNMTWWGNVLDFTRASKAKMVFGLSLNTGHDRRRPMRRLLQFPQVWDPSNARALLEWTIKRGDSDLLFGFELGNEQNSKYDGDTTAKNFKILQELVDELWPGNVTKPKLIGPDPHSLKQDGPEKAILDWIRDFLQGCKEHSVDLYAMTHHEYIEVDQNSFTSPSKLDVTKASAVAINRTVATTLPGVQPWAGEVGPHNGGSPPCDHTTMRWANFGDSLWYADAMAVKAAHGYGAFCRQDYIGADYGMLDCATGAPLPDYWTAIAFGQLMGQAVLQASVTTQNSSAIRAYAHCTTNSTSSLTVLIVNLARQTVKVELEFSTTAVGRLDTQSEYHLEQSPDPSVLYNATGMLGTGVQLNGELLRLGADGSVPVLTAVDAQQVGQVQVGPESVTFVVVKGGQSIAELCST